MEEESKICPNCNSECSKSSNFCENCGQAFVSDTTQFLIKLFYFAVIVVCVLVFISLNTFDLSCDSGDVLGLTINTFKESSLYYRTLSPNQIDSVVIKNPKEVSHNDSKSKYFCKGTVVVNFTDERNYKCNIEYTAEQKGDDLYVETTNCNDRYINRELNRFYNALEYSY